MNINNFNEEVKNLNITLTKEQSEILSSTSSKSLIYDDIKINII